MKRIAETDRQIEILQIFRNDGTTRKIDQFTPDHEQIYLNTLGFQRDKFVEDGIPDWDKFNGLLENYLVELKTSKFLKEYRKVLKRHLRRLKISWMEYENFMRVFLTNAILDVQARYDLENRNRNK